MRVLARSFCLVLVILILACATVAQAKTSLRRVSKISAASLKITPQVLRGKIIFLRGDDVWMFDPETRREQILFKNQGSRWNPFDSENAFDFSPDLKSCVVKSFHPDMFGNDLSIIELQTGLEKKLVVSKPKHDIIEPRFSPDGNEVIYARRGGYHWQAGQSHLEIWSVNSDGSNDHPVIGSMGATNLFESYFNAFWSHDKKRLLFTYHGGAAEDYEGLRYGELQTCAVDGSNVKKFDGDYGQYLRSDVSPNFKLRAVIEPLSAEFKYYFVLRLYSSRSCRIRELVTNNDFISIANPQWSANSERVIFQATQMYTRVEKSGYASQVQSTDIWAVGVSGGSRDLRLIVKNARLLTWLH